MQTILLEIVIIVILISANGLFAMAEMAVVSARKARLQQSANRGDRKARAALELADDPNQFLSTVQVGITLIGILAGAFGGATLAEELALRLSQIPWLAPYSQSIGLGIVVLGITYLSLVLGELVPKRLALNNPERVAASVAIPMRMLSRLTSAINRFLNASTDIVLRVLSVRPSTEPPVTEEEIRILVEEGTRAGVFDAVEEDLVSRVFRFGNRRVGALMTPRIEIDWLDIEESPEEIINRLLDSSHHLIPVGQDELDNLLGVVRARDVLSRCLGGQPLDLNALLQEPLVVPENMSALKVLELFKKTGQKMALVMDEYGGTQGMVTHTDILEALVGDMLMMSGTAEARVVKRQDGSWLLDGMLLIDEFKDIYHFDELPGEKRAGYQTLGGFVMSQMGSVPSEGETFEWDGWCFEVVDMDGRRVDKVLMAPMRASQPDR